jgi:23S rRNA (pseudouridine1915-N3)-methyltransferase
MKFQFWSLGKPHEPYVKPGVENFTGRIAKYYPVDWSIISPPKNAGLLDETALKKKEADILLAGLSKEDYLVALDERGKSLGSEQLATFIQARANDSTRQLIFLIGGAYGLHENILNRANFKWSLSLLTFPHQLVRLILAEQVYRACTIIRNEKYHHQ